MLRARSGLALAAVFSIGALAAYAAPRPIVVAALKGPSGIGMVEALRDAARSGRRNRQY